VFHRSGATWSQQARLLASNAKQGDNLGFSAAVFGDTVVLDRAYSSFLGGHGPGSAFILKHVGAARSQQAEVPTPSGIVDDDFGFAVSASGATVLIGAWEDDEAGPNARCGVGSTVVAGATGAGAAYVFPIG
jgi:hypothetical protein